MLKSKILPREHQRRIVDSGVFNKTIILHGLASYPAHPRRIKIEISSGKVMTYSIYARACFHKTNERGSANEEVLRKQTSA